MLIPNLKSISCGRPYFLNYKNNVLDRRQNTEWAYSDSLTLI